MTWRVLASVRDHPRSRGVYGNMRAGMESHGGSSPLARGLHRRHPGHRLPGRIIPARAGFTSRTSLTPSSTWDHPRSRGVYAGSSSGTRSRAGSSPLARGLRQGGEVADHRLRIIPARAGFTISHYYDFSRIRDHPRSRGVYVTSAELPENMTGSSPLARGLREVADDEAVTGRIIPARAGFTRPTRNRAHCRRDHPRSRGVYAGLLASHLVGPGSSPLARGLPESAHHSPAG